MGTEEDMRLFWIFAVADLKSDQLGHRAHITGVIKPASDAPDRQLTEGGIPLTQPLQLPETGSTRADGEVGIQRKHNHFVDAVGLDIADGRLREGMSVTHGHIAGGIDSTLTQEALQIARLLLGDASQR